MRTRFGYKGWSLFGATVCSIALGFSLSACSSSATSVEDHELAVAKAAVKQSTPQRTTVGELRRARPELPRSIPDDYVEITHGFSHPSCVHHVGANERVVGGDIVSDDGSVQKVTPCQYVGYDHAGRSTEEIATLENMRSGTATAAANSIDGWAEDVWGKLSSSGIKRLDSHVWVPDAPSYTPIGMSLSIWPGLEDYAPGNPYNNAHSSTEVLQPVIVYHQSNSAWTAYGEFCIRSPTTTPGKACDDYTGTSISVLPGDQVTSSVAGTSCNNTAGTCASWKITVRNERNLESQSLIVINASPYPVQWAFSGVLEPHIGTSGNPSSCDQLPASGLAMFSTTFTDMSNNRFYAPNPETYPGAGYSPDCKFVPSVGRSWEGQLAWWTGKPFHGLPFDTVSTIDASSPPGTTHWDGTNHIAQCALPEIMTGLSGNCYTGMPHSALCTYNGYVDPAYYIVLSPATMRDCVPGFPNCDWDVGYYKEECAQDEAVIGISSSTSGGLRKVLCAGLTGHKHRVGTCVARQFDTADNRGNQSGDSHDWAPTYCKGECNIGEFVKGVSMTTDSFHKVHKILCCPMGN